MIKLLTVLVLFLFSCSPKARQTPFEEAINQLVFGAHFMDSTAQLITTLTESGELTYEPPKVYQSNLNLSILMGTDQAWSSRHQYSFTKSPLPGYQVKSGDISVTLGQTATRSRVIGRSWTVVFETEKDARLFFDRLNQIFVPLSDKHKAYTDEEGYHVLELSSQHNLDRVIDIVFFMGKSIGSTTYEINLFTAHSLENG